MLLKCHERVQDYDYCVIRKKPLEVENSGNDEINIKLVISSN